MARGEFDINDQLTAYASVGVTKWDYHGLSADKAEVYNSAGDMKTTLGATGDDNQRKSLDLGLNGRFQTGNIGHQIATNVTRYEEEYSLYAARFRGVSIDSNLYNPTWGTRPDLNLDLPLLTTTETTLSSFGLADTLSFADDKYQLTLGARYQQVKTEQVGGMLSTGEKYDESAITPSAALVLKLTDQVSVYANYIEGLSKGATAPTNADNAGEIFSPYKTKQKKSASNSIGVTSLIPLVFTKSKSLTAIQTIIPISLVIMVSNVTVVSSGTSLVHQLTIFA